LWVVRTTFGREAVRNRELLPDPGTLLEAGIEQRPNDPRGYFLLARECLCPPQEQTARALQLSARSVELSSQHMDLSMRQVYVVRDLLTRSMPPGC